MCENCIPVALLWRWRFKDSVVLNIGWHFYCRWRSRRCEVLIVFCVERPSEEGVFLGWGTELCGSSSCVWGLRSLLNTKGILTLPMFLLSDGSLIQCEVLILLNDVGCCYLCLLLIIVKSLSSAFWVFVEMWWFLIALLVWFLWPETLSFRDLLVLHMYSAVQLWAGAIQWQIMSVFWASGIRSFGCMSKDLMVVVTLKNPNLAFCLDASVVLTEAFDYGMTTLVPSLCFPWMGMACWKNCPGYLFSCRILWRLSISLARNSGIEHPSLVLWMRVLIGEDFAEMGSLEYLSVWVGFPYTLDSMELGMGLVWVSRKGSPSITGSSKVNLTCGSMEMTCPWSLLAWSFLVVLWTSSTCLNYHLSNVGDLRMAKDSKRSM